MKRASKQLRDGFRLYLTVARPCITSGSTADSHLRSPGFLHAGSSSLRRLSSEIPFLRREDDEGEWFRYHHLREGSTTQWLPETGNAHSMAWTWPSIRSWRLCWELSPSCLPCHSFAATTAAFRRVGQRPYPARIGYAGCVAQRLVRPR